MVLWYPLRSSGVHVTLNVGLGATSLTFIDSAALLDFTLTGPIDGLRSTAGGIASSNISTRSTRRARCAVASPTTRAFDGTAVSAPTPAWETRSHDERHTADCQLPGKEPSLR
jgi:hypothetical protein